jgi:inosine-uridine nucleoside N-ribohydrolase
MRPLKTWIDADTGNEMDDPYAILYALLSPAFDVVGLSSVHFNNADLVAFERWNQYPTRGIDPISLSQGINEDLLAALGRSALPHPRGADRQMGRAWGGREPRDCPAARALIAAALALPAGEKLHVLGLGAVTNLASAIALEPTVAPRLSIHLLGADYDPVRQVWNKNEFNVRNDLNGFDYLLDHAGLELAIMPLSTARTLTFDKTDTLATLDRAIPSERLLIERWEETNPQDQMRILWDLALVQAVARPELATFAQVRTPPENTDRTLGLYASIQADAMRNDFFETVRRARVSGLNL